MADGCNFQRQLARQVASYNYGDLNPVAKSELGTKYNESTTWMTAAKKAVQQAAQGPSAYAGGAGGAIRALVLYAWEEKVTMDSAPKIFVHIKAAIPELDMLPLPSALPTDNDPNDKCADWNIINMYSTFVAESPDLPLPKPADIIKVDFGNRTSFTDPIYLGLVSRTLLFCEDELANKNKLPTKDCLEALKRDMEKISETQTFHDGVPFSDTPEQKEAAPLDHNKAPVIGVYIPPYYKRYKKKNRETGFWTPDWIEIAANAGINYVGFKLNGIAAARNGTVISDAYTKELTGRTVKEEIDHILRVAKAINPEFEVHGWGYSGAQRFGTGKKTVTRTGATIQRPRNQTEAKRLAVREAQAVGKRMKALGLTDYHWNAEASAFQGYPGHAGFSGNPSGRRTGAASRAMNDITAITFANELRKHVPQVRIWFNGMVECVSQSVLMEYFDVIEPMSWPCSASAFRRKLDGKHLSAPEGRPLLPVTMDVSWTIPDGHRGTYTGNRAAAWEALKEKIMEHKARIYGVNIFNMTSQLHQSLNDWPSIPNMVKQLRDGYNKV